MHVDVALSTFVRQKKAYHRPLRGVCPRGPVVLHDLTSGVIGGEGDLSRTVFFSDFFTWLVMSDILISTAYKHTTDFNHLARNTGFGCPRW